MKMTINKNDRKFIIYTHWVGSAMLEVDFWEEKRPHWKIFKSGYLTTKTLFIDDYSSIAIGIQAKLDKYLEEEEYDKEISRKWKEFEQFVNSQKTY
jgi:hypothetical protein